MVGERNVFLSTESGEPPPKGGGARSAALEYPVSAVRVQATNEREQEGAARDRPIHI